MSEANTSNFHAGQNIFSLLFEGSCLLIFALGSPKRAQMWQFLFHVLLLLLHVLLFFLCHLLVLNYISAILITKWSLLLSFAVRRRTYARRRSKSFFNLQDIHEKLKTKAIVVSMSAAIGSLITRSLLDVKITHICHPTNFEYLR